MAIADDTALSDRIYEEKQRLSDALGYEICGDHDGNVRPDGAPSLCVGERHHAGEHFYIRF